MLSVCRVEVGKIARLIDFEQISLRTCQLRELSPHRVQCRRLEQVCKLHMREGCR